MADVSPRDTTLVMKKASKVTADGYSYKIHLYTGDVWGAGTDANVLVTIYGEDCDSEQSILSNSGSDFQRDSVDNFKIVTSSYLGRIKKIVIGHDNSGLNPSWFLNKVTVEDVKTREVFEFPCRRWLAKDEDDGLISRELAWTNVTVKEQEDGETYPYTINIHTGNVWGAGTDANVHITIYGKQSRSRKYKLKNRGKGNFESGMRKTVKIETKTSLGTLYKVRVGHDNTGFGPGWFLDKIEVEDDITGEIVNFSCGKWLATNSEDGLISRDLMREGFVEEVDSSLESVTYTVNIFTGHPWGAGTDANVFLTLYGVDAESHQQKIENKGSTTFENGMTDTIKFESPHLGALTKIRIGHDNTGWGPAWYLDKVTVEDPKKGETVEFPCYRWLATNADDGMIERELVRKDGSQVDGKKGKKDEQEKIEKEQREKKTRQEKEQQERRQREEKERKEREEKDRREREMMEELLMFEEEVTVECDNPEVEWQDPKTKKEDKKQLVMEEMIQGEEGGAVMAEYFGEDLYSPWLEQAKEEEKEAQEHLEKERRERLEMEKQEQVEKEKQKRLEKERQERLEKEKQERLEKEKQERLEKEKQERLEKVKQEQLEKKQKELEKEKQKRLEKEKQKQLEKQRQEQLEKEKQEQLEKERQEQLEKERQERLEKKKQERLEKEKQYKTIAKVPGSLQSKALGMESGDIKDDQITASTFTENTNPTWARLNFPSSWCAGKLHGSWLQVDLKTLHWITGVATQGNPKGYKDYVKAFQILYSQDGEKWTDYEENGNKIFDANVDHSSIKITELQKVIVARYIRICPVEWYVWPCMRVELYGAPLTKEEQLREREKKN